MPGVRTLRCVCGPARRFSSSRRRCAKETASKHVLRDYNITTTFRYSLLHDLPPQVQAYPWATPTSLRRVRTPPRRVKMIAREYRLPASCSSSIDTSSFVYDSLYNPNYGYFSKQARIFSPSEPFEFPKIKNSLAYDRLVADAINKFEDSLGPERDASTSRQVFHTPSELFKPYYGEALARHLVHQYRLHYYPHANLCIYEIGGGNGTLMLNILDYIRENDPQVYNSMEYRTIEISPQLAKQQRQTIEKSKFGRDHSQHVETVQMDVLTWNVPVRHPCYVLAMEVIDNLPHDVIRYDPTTGRPLQGVVLIDEQGEFEEAYTASMDELPQKYLSLREKLGYKHLPLSHPQRTPAILRRAFHSLPYTGKLSSKEFIPTTLLQLLDVLNEYFPHHHLLLSDFDSLPNAIPGYMSPVVQTRYQRSMVPCTTYLVQQGYFDIFFPTDFEELQGLYGMLCPSYFGTRRTQIVTHKEFLEKWGDLKATTTRSGENPMTDYYKNVRMLIS